MPFRSRETLEHWVAEFVADRGAGDLIKVVVQDGPDGSDTGLVVVPLAGASTSVFMEPLALGDPQWRVTFEAQSDVTLLSSRGLHGLAAELHVAAELCAYLEARSVGHIEDELQR